MKPIAFVTMVHQDHDMLRKWVRHYETLVEDRRALVIAAHGPDPEIARIAAGCTLIELPRDTEATRFEDARRNFFWGMVQALNGFFQFVVTLDVDEFLIVAPAAGVPLVELLRGRRFRGAAASPVGIDMVHRPSVETDDAPLSGQVLGRRRHGVLNGVYCKPCIYRSAYKGGGTQHSLHGEPWDIEPLLWLLHLRFYDRGFAEAQAALRAEQATDLAQREGENALGGWPRRMRQLQASIHRVETEAPQAMTWLLARRFARKQIAAYEARGRKLDWRAANGPVVRLPEAVDGIV